MQASQTDARGNTTTYNVNTANGTVNSVTTPVTVNGSNTTVTTGYSYNNTTRLLESVSHSSLTPSLDYSYDSKWRLTGITLGDLGYSFAYDAFGNRLRTKLGDTTLASYSYVSPRKGLLGSMTYGNGATVSYTYDSLDRQRVYPRLRSLCQSSTLSDVEFVRCRS